MEAIVSHRRTYSSVSDSWIRLVTYGMSYLSFFSCGRFWKTEVDRQYDCGWLVVFVSAITTETSSPTLY